jgi:hypothetical protein
MTSKEIAARMWASKEEPEEHWLEEAPTRVKAAPRFASDMEALTSLFASVHPPKRLVRSLICLTVFYGFGDASGVGHADNYQGFRKVAPGWIKRDKRIHFRYGHWCEEVSKTSSNYRELLNLVDSLEAQVEDGRIRGAEVFLFTDNLMAEAVFFKGNSTSERLFKLMLRLQKIEMKGDLLLYVIHVVGTRMIEEGADGGSRGDLLQGAMAGHSVIVFVPLHLSALERSSELEPSIHSWWDELRGDLETLSPEGWFEEGQKDGHFLWAPPPAAADVVAEQLGEARHKRPFCTHITVVPRLMTGRWRKTLGKEADLLVEIPAGVPFWESAMHEPLILCISLPLCRQPPWTFKQTGFMEGLHWELHKVWKSVPEPGRDLLRQLPLQEREFHSLPKGVVWELLWNYDWRSVSNSGADGRGRIRKRRHR